MKTRYAVCSAILAIAFTLPTFGQPVAGGKSGPDAKAKAMPDMTGKATLDAMVEGVHMQVWVMTPKEHEGVMKGNPDQMTLRGEKEGATGVANAGGMGMSKETTGVKHEGMGMTRPVIDSTTADTYQIMLDITDVGNGKGIPNAIAIVLVVSPSKKNSSIELTPMMNHFSGTLSLEEKGEYQLTVSVNAGGVSKSKQFLYAVK